MRSSNTAAKGAAKKTPAYTVERRYSNRRTAAQAVAALIRAHR